MLGDWILWSKLPAISDQVCRSASNQSASTRVPDPALLWSSHLHAYLNEARRGPRPSHKKRRSVHNAPPRGGNGLRGRPAPNIGIRSTLLLSRAPTNRRLTHSLKG